MGIDPHNLGQPVYKSDQVITKDDLNYLIRCYRNNENVFMNEGKIKEGLSCCIAHQVIEAVLEWLEKGKEKGEVDNGNDAWLS